MREGERVRIRVSFIRSFFILSFILSFFPMSLTWDCTGVTTCCNEVVALCLNSPAEIASCFTCGFRSINVCTFRSASLRIVPMAVSIARCTSSSDPTRGSEAWEEGDVGADAEADAVEVVAPVAAAVEGRKEGGKEGLGEGGGSREDMGVWWYSYSYSYTVQLQLHSTVQSQLQLQYSTVL